MEPAETSIREPRRASFMSQIVLVMRYIAVRMVDSGAKNLDVVRGNAALFGGAALTTIGLLSFRADRFCDGNSSDYLSCTRPAVYYSYGALEITLVIIGVFFILVWMIRESGARR